jgi:Recombination endonuclease VII
MLKFCKACNADTERTGRGKCRPCQHAYNMRPDVKAKRDAYSRSEVARAKRRAYNQSPAVVERRHERWQNEEYRRQENARKKTEAYREAANARRRTEAFKRKRRLERLTEEYRAKAWSYQQKPEAKRAARARLGLPEPTRPRPATCECCGQPPKDGRGQYVVLDHDHATGAFRGWLCWHCNTGIGKLGDTVEGLERAVNYLKRSAA